MKIHAAIRRLIIQTWVSNSCNDIWNILKHILKTRLNPSRLWKSYFLSKQTLRLSFLLFPLLPIAHIVKPIGPGQLHQQGPSWDTRGYGYDSEIFPKKNHQHLIRQVWGFTRIHKVCLTLTNLEIEIFHEEISPLDFGLMNWWPTAIEYRQDVGQIYQCNASLGHSVKRKKTRDQRDYVQALWLPKVKLAKALP